MGASKPIRLGQSVTDIAVRAQERRARKLMLQGDLDGAIAVYREIVALDPDGSGAHYQLGLCYRQRRQWDEAAAALARARDLGETRAIGLLHEMRRMLPNSQHLHAPADDEMAPAVVVGGKILTQSPPPATAPGPDAPPDEAEGSPRVAESPAVYVVEERRSAGSRADIEIAGRPIVCPPVASVFAPGGTLANALGDRFRARAGQAKMADLVRDALQNRHHAILEAGTGIGKSFAYLVPVLWSGAPAVVSTSNKGLMNQLWEQDIPRLQEIAPRPTKAALLKGRGNYVCAMHLDRLRQQVGLPNQRTWLALVARGLETVPTGDMETMRLPPDLVARLAVGGRECRGHHCPQFDSCFYENAKREAAEADLVVTNHALLCYNALLADNHILPVRAVLIIDEAHQLPRYAVEALTMALGHDEFWGLVNSPPVRSALPDADLLTEARTAYDDFFGAVERQRPGDTRSATRPTRWQLTGEIQTGLALWDVLEQLRRTLTHAAQLDDGDREAALMQTAEVAETVHALSLPEPETHIRLCETEDDTSFGTPGAFHALYRPLEVTDPLRRMLFDTWPRVICTSATLGVNNDLGWFGRQIGLVPSDNHASTRGTRQSSGDTHQSAGRTRQSVPGTLQSAGGTRQSAGGTRQSAGGVIFQALPGPFDYAKQMLLYTPEILMPVYDEERQAFSGDYVDELTAEVGRLLETSRGRALVLCTSRRRMMQLYDTLAPSLNPRYPCYLQGDATQPELVARFKEDGNAILFATRGFWEGLDIPGESLALVILDKIPFVPYDDPVIRRQEERIRARGGNSFYELQLGSAILSLRQGAGRLIRSETDRGVIALLDARVLSKRYGQQIIRSLPEGCHTTDFADVAAFLS